jgi:predicted Ser/Thr protein kinase
MIDIGQFCSNHRLLKHNVKQETLGGGNINYVFRIRLTDSSVVVKHFPPFLASNNSVPFSSDRYFIEKEALFVAHQLPHFVVPKVIDFDDKQHVLIIEDLGSELISLFQVFQSNEKLEKGLAGKLVEFLNALNTIKMDSPIFNHLNAHELIKTHCYGGFEERLKEYPFLFHWIDKVKEQMDNMPPCTPNLSLVMGDLWPNSVFYRKCDGVWCIIDWEFMRKDHKTTDVTRLVSYLNNSHYCIAKKMLNRLENH